ncbi:mitochondrial inner membrane protein OXA1L-like [Agrilus planipennis]|uniref:Mitochondrial inner membrane protein OXA1L-like n=1 Tax=Agrilus planipennis TaxID=224129 RepID=A0A7F5REC3_AGRPL|nr:mitochondrial inner membrane protein OXA1L-like [Agrilus planipennis]XP_025834335.1 mitochondrial inner membrane protein OXA1L-like [Agrilus planipennis]
MRNIATIYQNFSRKCKVLKAKVKQTQDFFREPSNYEKYTDRLTAKLSSFENNFLHKYEWWIKKGVLARPLVGKVSHKHENEEDRRRIKGFINLKGQQYLQKNKNSIWCYSAVPVIASEISDKAAIVEKISEKIPEPPPVPDASVEVLNQINALGEPTFASLGLGGWSPIGIVQSTLEYIHVTCGLPWWGTIAVGTIIVRVLMFPLVIISQRNAAKMNNYMPQMQILQLKMTEARQIGNHLDVARYSQELMAFMKEKGLNPFKNMLVPLAQMPLFISFFMGLRQMANVPVDSLREGGMLWFTDLTLPDQYYGLPLITSFTLWVTIEVGTDAGKLSSQNLQTMKYILRAVPVLILPFTVNFPAAILCYWASSNFISLIQVGILRIPTIRDYFKIEPLVNHKPENLPIKSKGFVGGIKDTWTNLKVSKEIEDRQRFDEVQFRRAGRGPVVKTYKYDPTKQTVQQPVINAKKR